MTPELAAKAKTVRLSFSSFLFLFLFLFFFSFSFFFFFCCSRFFWSSTLTSSRRSTWCSQTCLPRWTTSPQKTTRLAAQSATSPLESLMTMSRLLERFVSFFFSKKKRKKRQPFPRLQRFHPDCFSCAHCRKILGKAPYIEHSGQVYCLEDHATLFGAKCAFWYDHQSTFFAQERILTTLFLFLFFENSTTPVDSWSPAGSSLPLELPGTPSI